MDEKTKKGIDKTVEIRYNNGRARRGVAQFGRVLGLGPRCRRFESCRLDHKRVAKKMPSKKPRIYRGFSHFQRGIFEDVFTDAKE